MLDLLPPMTGERCVRFINHIIFLYYCSVSICLSDSFAIFISFHINNQMSFLYYYLICIHNIHTFCLIVTMSAN